MSMIEVSSERRDHAGRGTDARHLQTRSAQNVDTGIKARSPIARELVENLLSIRPPNASGQIHANPEPVGRKWTSASSGNACSRSPRNVRVQLAGKKAKFLYFRHSGASHIAQRGRGSAPACRRQDDWGIPALPPSSTVERFPYGSVRAACAESYAGRFFVSRCRKIQTPRSRGA